jgi:hypothetical protein
LTLLCVNIAVFDHCFSWKTEFYDDAAVEHEDDYGMEALDVYEHPLLQQAHEFIIENKLSVSQGDNLLNLWTEVKQCRIKFAV